MKGVSAMNPSGGKKSVLVAMSGGVDSSAVVKLLLDEGYEVAGVTMVLTDGVSDATGISSEEVRLAKSVCDLFSIKHYAIDLRNDFFEDVIVPFCRTYIDGHTPNPCVLCNKHLKFGTLHKIRQELGYDFLATGHYVKKEFDDVNAKWRLLRAADLSKDQSYFLYNITQDELAHTIFPLADMDKAATRAFAAESQMEVADRQESQDICFIKDGDHVGFIEHTGAVSNGAIDLKNSFVAGDIVDTGANVVGRHTGLIHYTLGQRRGIGVAASEPYYVIGKDVEKNQLVVGFVDEAMISHFKVRDVNIVSGEGLKSLDADKLYRIKARYRQEPVFAHVSPEGDDGLAVDLDEPCKITSAGQSLVIYDGDEVVGGGVIASVSS